VSQISERLDAAALRRGHGFQRLVDEHAGAGQGLYDDAFAGGNTTTVT
jgi:hypothetical protein